MEGLQILRLRSPKRSFGRNHSPKRGSSPFSSPPTSPGSKFCYYSAPATPPKSPRDSFDEESTKSSIPFAWEESPGTPRKDSVNSVDRLGQFGLGFYFSAPTSPGSELGAQDYLQSDDSDGKMEASKEFEFASARMSDAESVCSHADELFFKGKILPLEHPAKPVKTKQVFVEMPKKKQLKLDDSVSYGYKCVPNSGLRSPKTPKSSKYTFRGEFYGSTQDVRTPRTPRTPLGVDSTTPKSPRAFGSKSVPNPLIENPWNSRESRSTKKNNHRSRSVSPIPPPFDREHNIVNARDSQGMDFGDENAPPREDAPSLAQEHVKSRGSSMRKTLKDFLHFSSRNGTVNNNNHHHLHKSSSRKSTLSRSSSKHSGRVVTPYEVHYKPSKGGDESRRRTFLPYKQGLLGWLGCVTTGFAHAPSDVSGRYD